MRKMNRAGWLASALGCALLTLGAVALAQQPTDAPGPTQPQTQPDAQPATQPQTQMQAITPQRSRPTEHNRGDKAPAEIDWSTARALVATMREREVAFERQVDARSLTQPLTAGERLRLAPRGLRAVAPERLRNISEAAVARVRLPVLIPLTDEIADIVRIASNENSYTAIARLPDGATVEMLGTRMRVVGGSQKTMAMRMAARRNMKERLEGLETEFAINHHDEGVDLSFSKFNAAYQISVYCPDPDADARCTGDDFVRGLAESMAVLNETRGGE